MFWKKLNEVCSTVGSFKLPKCRMSSCLLRSNLGERIAGFANSRNHSWVAQPQPSWGYRRTLRCLRDSLWQTLWHSSPLGLLAGFLPKVLPTLWFVPLPPITLQTFPLSSLLSIPSLSAFVTLDPVRFSSTWAFTVFLSVCSSSPLPLGR